MQKSAIQKRIEAQLTAPSRTREDSNVNDKKPVPPSLAQFALEQLAEGVEPNATSRAEELITQLEAEIVKRDARIEDLEAQLEDTEERRANSSRNASAFEQRMGDLQVENGKLKEAKVLVEIAASSVVEAKKSLERELAALKAQQPSGVVLPESRAMSVFAAATIAPQEGEKLTRERLDAIVEIGHDRIAFAASLNPCRAQAVPDGYVLVPVDGLKHVRRDLDACQKVIWLGMRSADPAYCSDAQARLVDIDTWLAAAPSAKKES